MFFFKKVKSRGLRLGLNLLAYSWIGSLTCLLLGYFLPGLLANYVYVLMIAAIAAGYIGLFVTIANLILSKNAAKKPSYKPKESRAVFSPQKTQEVKHEPPAKEPPVTTEPPVLDPMRMVEVVSFRGFGFWVESLSEIKEILAFMQPAVEALESQSYRVAMVWAGGGVHERDTGYESFSGSYASFEEAKEKLPLEFREEESQLDGHWFTTLNFEDFSIRFQKDAEEVRLLFSRGKVYATAPIAELIPVEEMKAAYESV